MKICFVTPRLPPYSVGGVETYVNAIAGYLSKKHDVVVITADMDEKHDHDYEVIHVPKTNQPIFAREIFNPFMYSRFLKIFKEERPDIVHLNNIEGFSMAPLFAGSKLNCGVVCHMHGFELLCPKLSLIKGDKICESWHCLNCMKDGAKAFLFNLLQLTLPKVGLRMLRKKIIDNVDIFLSNTNCTRDIHIEHGFPQEKITTLYYPSPQAGYLDAKRADEKTGVVLYVGRLIERKGVQYLLEALSHLKDKPYNLWIVGVGDYQGTLGEMTKELELTDKVKFYGKMFGSELFEIYDAADVVAIPSLVLEAGTTLVAHEAMSLGKPIIGSNIGGIPEAIDDGKTGIIVDPRDTLTFAKKIDQVLSNEDFRIMLGENAKKKNDEMFSIETHADNLLKIYESVTSGNQP